MSPVRKTWVLDQEIHWRLNTGIPAIPASCFLVPEQTVVCGSYFIWRYILKSCVPAFFIILTPQFQELFCASFSRTYLYPSTSALLFISNSDIIFCFYLAPDPSLEIFPLVAAHGTVGVGYFLLNFHWHFSHDACCAEVLHLNTLFYRLHFSQALCHIPALLTGRACEPVL